MKTYNKVFVGYGYDLEDSPDWYQQAWKDSEKFIISIYFHFE